MLYFYYPWFLEIVNTFYKISCKS